MIASLVHTPAAVASWGVQGVQFGAFTEDGTEFNIQMRNTFGSDGSHYLTGIVPTRSAVWAPGSDLAPDDAPRPSAFFSDVSRFCPSEELFPESLLVGYPTYLGDPRGNPGGPCWTYNWLRGTAATKPGPWGYGVPVVADGPDGSDLVFDRWDAPQADTAGRCYTGDVGIIAGGLDGANGMDVHAVGFRGYVDALNPDPTKRGDYSAKAIYAPITPDTSPPIVTIRTDLDCQQLAKDAVFHATYTCQDPGLALTPAESCVGPVADGSPVDTSTVGVYSFTVTGTDAVGNARSKTVHYTVTEPPAITSADQVTFTAGSAGSFTVTTTPGFPAATTLSQVGVLPGGVSFTDNGGGTATLAGTATTGGSFPLTIRATNPAGHTEQAFTLTVTQRSQTITFAPLPDRTYGSGPFTIDAAATSGLAVTFTSSTPSVCTMAGTAVTLAAAGTCSITARQPGNTVWQAATPVVRSFIVGYGVAQFSPPNKSVFKVGSTIPIKFQLISASGTPIPTSVAASLGCTVQVRFSSLTPVCATYNATSQLFQANVSTPSNLPPRTSYQIVMTVKVGTTVVATASTTVIAK